MNLPLRVRPEAAADLQEAATWYEQQRPGLGGEFLDAVLAVFAGISQQPEIHAIVHRQTRRALTARFPFAVFYRIESKYVVVVAVMHGRRDPRRWKTRT
ncbi:MAG: type II toxin-antitoxin system RelE/ParE family toxin [Proteobacteria bacterium]|nr:type II toxin-antitoxin system RelE/ParE family toxin [Pseudomonadota bacterium]